MHRRRSLLRIINVETPSEGTNIYILQRIPSLILLEFHGKVFRFTDSRQSF